MRVTFRALISCAVLAHTGCAGFDAGGYRTFAATQAREAGWHGLPVETGQVIVAEHPGATSLFLALTTEEYQPYLHTGLIAIEAGRPYVYEAMGAILPLPWTKPNEHVGGGVRRVTLDSFLSRGGIVAIYDPPPNVDRSVLAGFVEARWRERYPFDGRYDARDASRYYCVEFVARALEAAGAAPVRAVPLTRNPSMQVALGWLDIRGPDLLMAGTLIAPERRVALISRGLSATEIGRYFELKRELHRRFTRDQRLGNVLFWRGQRLRLRPGVDAYFEDGIRVETGARELADRMFGTGGSTVEARVATATP